MVSAHPALILDMQITALATARCLADAGIHVDAASFSNATAERRSNSFNFIDVTHVPRKVDHIADWLYDHASGMRERPVVFPTSDTTALAIAKHRDKLKKVCTIWNTQFDELQTIVSKEGLHARAKAAGVNTPPAIVEPEVDQAIEWCRSNPGPYLVKPFYHNIPTSKLTEKNLVLESSEKLMAFLHKYGSDSLIIQRLIRGGDGHVFDCYGLTNSEFKIVTRASHTRLRQSPRNFGTTSYGEIPARPGSSFENSIFNLTERLLSELRYHGIFGIEWIEDRKTGDLFLIDFNARPFLSVGHLQDCGLNLPLLAYQELVGKNLDHVPALPKLKHKYWLYFVNDIQTLPERLQDKEITRTGWLLSLFKARSFACWRLNDMGPGLHFLVRYFKSTLKTFFC